MEKAEVINRLQDIMTFLQNDIDNEPDADTRVSMEDDLRALQIAYTFYKEHTTC